ncbi:MAG: NAD(P)-binding domain-containing protein [Thermoanaerobaculia bacterium]|nr:NAD(P)-binding domain-containing protein [Thermoanaerobaculia bacterium]
MKIGMIGLGRMGMGLSERLLDGGHEIVGFDHEAEALGRLEEAGGRKAGSLEGLVEQLESPRIVWMMLPAGGAVESTTAALEVLLEAGDRLVDGGNSNYRRTIERGRRLLGAGIHFVDVGTSGGVWGRDEGYCLMIGGSDEAVEPLHPLFERLAPAPERGWAHVGPSGAGHFVKMIHNGIEYGLMQA